MDEIEIHGTNFDILISVFVAGRNFICKSMSHINEENFKTIDNFFGIFNDIITLMK